MTPSPTILRVCIALDLSCGHTVFADRRRLDLLNAKGSPLNTCEVCSFERLKRRLAEREVP